MFASEGLAIIDIIAMYSLMPHLPKSDMTLACSLFTIISVFILTKIIKDELFSIDWKLKYRSDNK